MNDDTRLDEYTKEEWRDIVFQVRPDIPDDQFDQLWEDFVKMQGVKKLQ